MSHILRKGNFGYEVFEEDIYEESLGIVRRTQAKSIVKAVQESVPKKGSWLDIGCGTGMLLEQAKKAEFQVLGIDPDPEACKKARKLLGKDQVKQELMNENTVPNASQNVISATDLLEHIPAHQVNAFLLVVHAKLKKDGYFVVKVPSREGLYYLVIHSLARVLGSFFFIRPLRRMWLTEYEYPHTFYFHAASLGRLLAQNGFSVRQVIYLNEIPNESIYQRIRLDQRIPKLLAFLLVPVFMSINFLERIRGKTDSLLVLAQRNEA